MMNSPQKNGHRRHREQVKPVEQRATPRRVVAMAGLLLTLTGCDVSKPWQVTDVDVQHRLGPPAETAPLAIPEHLRLDQQDTAAPAIPPDGPLQLSVEQAVVLALANNRALQVQQLEPVIAGTFEDLERAVFDPVAFAEGSMLREQRQSVSRATGTSFAVKGQDTNLRGGIAQQLPTGTQVEATVGEARTFSNRTPDQHEVRAGVTVTQALLRGADLAANVASIQQARLDTLASEFELRGFAEALVAEVETTYWDYVLAQREIQIVENALKVAQQQQEVTEQRIAVGQLAEPELTAAKAEVALRRQALIDARALAAKLRLKLLRLLNPAAPGGWQTPIKPTDEPTTINVPMDPVDDHVQLAIQLRPELNEAQLRVEQGRLQVVQTRNGLLPRLDLFVTLGKSGFADSFSSAARNVDGSDYDLLAGARFEVPLGNRDAQARHRGAVAGRFQSVRSMQNLAQLIEQDVRTAYVEVQRSAEQVDASAATRQLQEEVLRSEAEKFAVGKSTSLLVAQAQRDLLASQIADVEAVVNHRKALIDLYRLEGSLLKRRAITAPGSQPVRQRIASDPRLGRVWP